MRQLIQYIDNSEYSKVFMKLNQLTSFLAVIEHGSIRAAARALDVTQPGITKTVQDLEAGLGVQLLVRRARGVDLTEFGELLRVRANFLLNEVRRTKESLLYLRDKNSGSLVIGASATVANTLLPKALENLMAGSPGIDIAVKEGSLASFKPMLKEGTVDFVIACMALDFNDEDFDITRLCTYESVFGIRGSFSVKAPLHLSQLLELPWVLPGNSGAAGGSTFLEDMLKRYMLPAPKRVIHCDATATALGMMANTDMVGFFTKRVADQEFERLGLVQLPLVEPTPLTAISIVSSKDTSLSLVAQHLVDLLKLTAQSIAH